VVVVWSGQQWTFLNEADRWGSEAIGILPKAFRSIVIVHVSPGKDTVNILNRIWTRADVEWTPSESVLLPSECQHSSNRSTSACMATGRLLETLEGTKQHLTYRHVDSRNLKEKKNFLYMPNCGSVGWSVTVGCR